MRRALVLGGGGYAASAWEIGLATGMADAAIDVRSADLFVGTSSGARVALHLASGAAWEALFQRQLGPTPRPTARPPAVDWRKFRDDVMRAKALGGSPDEILRRIGALALATPLARDPQRRQTVAADLPTPTWPERNLVIAALNADTGERHAFDRSSGIDLVDAVLAAGAFFTGPPVLFEDHRYIDGGFYSTDNADLAAGFDRVLIVALRSRVPSLCVVSLESAVATLQSGGTEVKVIHPDQQTEAVFASAGSPMNPAVCQPAAQTGRLQGQRLAKEHAASFW